MKGGFAEIAGPQMGRAGTRRQAGQMEAARSGWGGQGSRRPGHGRV